MRRQFNFMTLLLGLLTAGTLPAQNQPSNVHLISRVTKNEIKLRWAPTDAETWRESTVKGFYLLRATVPTDTLGLASYAYDTLVNMILPLPSAQWEKLVDEDIHCAAAWTSLYEKKPASSGDLIQQIKQQEDILNKAYFVAMLAADQSQKAANAMGLQFTDKTAVNGKQYIYKVGIHGLKNDYSTTYADTKTIFNLASPLPPVSISKEKSISIKWNPSEDQWGYTTYHIERSESLEGPYTRLTSTPFLHLQNPNGNSSEYSYFTDTIGVNYKVFYYRLVGIDPFGEESIPSLAVAGMGRDLTPPPSPEHLTATTIENKMVKLEWSQPPCQDIKGYQISRAEDFEATFTPLHADLLPFNTLEFIDSTANPALNNYYLVSVVDTAGNVNHSESSYAFFKDNTPPPTPTLLTGSIDSTGLVTLKWNKVADPALIGYRVYYSNSPNHTFIMRSGDLITDTFYQEKLFLNTLSERILYKVAAVDIGYGHSLPTAALELKKPDKIKPASGCFKSVEVFDQSAMLTWAPGSSSDMVLQELWRENDLLQKTKMASFDTATATYTDTTLAEGQSYTYYLRSRDDDGLYSDFSTPVSVQSSPKELAAVNDLQAIWNEESKSISLKWSCPTKNVQYIIYRSIGDGALITYDNAGTTEFTDNYVSESTKYRYAVVVMDENGRQSGLSAITEVMAGKSKLTK